MIFESKKLCVSCGHYYRTRNMAHLFENIGICVDCDRALVRVDGKCCLDEYSDSVVIAPYYYDGGLRQAVLKFKFKDQPLYGKLFGHMLADALRDSYLIQDYDIVVPVPLHKSRLRERGYNQAEVIAEQFASETGISCMGNALFRTKNTKRQSSLVGSDRVLNVKDAFDADSAIVAGKKIILADDISTTGMTMNSCKHVLLAAGAQSVACMAFCKTPIKQRPIAQIPIKR